MFSLTTTLSTQYLTLAGKVEKIHFDQPTSEQLEFPVKSDTITPLTDALIRELQMTREASGDLFSLSPKKKRSLIAGQQLASFSPRFPNKRQEGPSDRRLLRQGTTNFNNAVKQTTNLSSLRPASGHRGNEAA